MTDERIEVAGLEARLALNATTGHCISCEHAVSFRLGRPIADAMLKAGVHLGSVTDGYEVEPTDTEGVYRLTFVFTDNAGEYAHREIAQ